MAHQPASAERQHQAAEFRPPAASAGELGSAAGERAGLLAGPRAKRGKAPLTALQKLNIMCCGEEVGGGG
jgi:hypothetical protein